ncbi:tol-pal system protein YbgF [Acidimangrovimonas sediminis]|uniref:tol-pal system protein YbgF n=1 Tax=Acidimangrovimonas sediminis TaxID=2056283 RepID=UPI000C7FB447|nr:tol-pal system protein YbgF [Acidimangrovimonas sediminis]
MPPKPSARPPVRTRAGRLAGLALVTLLGVAGAGVVAGPVLAQSQGGAPSASDRAQTLASIRKELSGLNGQIEGLKRELNSGGAGGQPAPASGSAQERLDAITAQLQQLTNQTEEIQHRLQVVVSDGSRRIDDLNFRLCELEKGCDIAKLKKQPKLGLTASDDSQGGGGAAAGGASGTSPNETADSGNAPDLAVGEQADFDKAKAALDKGDYQQAANLFGTFTQTYTAGPLTGQAHFYRGQALTAMGKTADAARAYLNSFSGSPDGVRAPDALTKLGISLGKLGQTQDACVTLGQVKVRYPASSAVNDAAAARQTLGCQ